MYTKLDIYALVNVMDTITQIKLINYYWPLCQCSNLNTFKNLSCPFRTLVIQVINQIMNRVSMFVALMYIFHLTVICISIYNHINQIRHVQQHYETLSSC
jgi:hypothetical protein